jgi:AAA15 family ATPase/GTPase
MNNLIQNITIENFKSIKKLEMKDCARINLIIGKPNVGKSNIIEALSVFSLTHLDYSSERLLTNTIRIENLVELFYQGDSSKKASIDIGIEKAQIEYQRGDVIKIDIQDSDKKRELGIGKDFKINEPHQNSTIFFSPVKRYIFKSGAGSKAYEYDKVFLPPFGINLYDILLVDVKLRNELKVFFEQYDSKLILDKASRTIKILSETEDSFILPYTSTADTLQRVIFFKTAIETNTNSVLIFEEPEAHAFPPYIAKITQEIIASETNQFFITTHSPYVLNDFLERREPELAIYLVNYKNHETVVKRLTDTEQDEVYQYGIDLFFNNESYWD